MKLGSLEGREISPPHRPLPAWIRLMRLEKPIGTWLLFWPCVWGILFALCERPSVSIYTGIWYGLLMAMGAIIMRGAGCTLNDIFDRHIDAQVERTKSRPLPAGDITLKGAIGLLILLTLMGGVILIQFPITTLILGTLTLPLIVLYPLTKRFFMLPQLVLGIVFNTGVLIGASSISFDVVSDYTLWLIYGAGIFWTLAYDTIYALQDVQDDHKVGIYSSARTFGGYAPFMIGLCFAVCIALLSVVGMIKQWGMPYILGLGLVSLHFAYQTMMTKKAFSGHQGDAVYSRLFKSNALCGGLIALAFALVFHLNFG